VSRALVRSGTTWVKQAKLTAHDGANGLAFGATVGLSADGKTALVGGPVATLVVQVNGAVPTPVQSAAWVFVRSGSTWTEQAKLSPNDVPFGVTSFAASVALSADGSTAILGGPGLAWVFGRAGSAWTQQGPKLSPTDAGGGARFGEAVALSADGSTALVGGSGYAGNKGAAWAFARAGGSWKQQGRRLTPRDSAGTAFFGEALALSGPGNTALIAGPYNGGAGTALGSGAAWVFARSGSVWRQEGARLVPHGAVAAPDSFGSRVALTDDGGTALIGGARAGRSGPGHDGPTGSAWVFKRSSPSWKQQGSALAFGGGVSSTRGVAFGQSLALTAAGSTALVGGPGDAGVGAVWTFALAR
jgi:hypothetical protein